MSDRDYIFDVLFVASLTALHPDAQSEAQMAIALRLVVDGLRYARSEDGNAALSFIDLHLQRLTELNPQFGFALEMLRAKGDGLPSPTSTKRPRICAHDGSVSMDYDDSDSLLVAVEFAPVESPSINQVCESDGTSNLTKSPTDLPTFIDRYHPGLKAAMQLAAEEFVAPLVDSFRVSFAADADAALHAAAVDVALRQHRLGRALVHKQFIQCDVPSFPWGQVAKELTSAVLLDAQVPPTTRVEEEVDGVWYSSGVHQPPHLALAPDTYFHSFVPGKPSRKRVHAGDIFVYRVVPDVYCFGRVLMENLRIGLGDDQLFLLYFYGATSSEADRIPRLEKESLILPPVLYSREPWRVGAFETVARRPVTAADLLQDHCFELRPLFPDSPPVYFDERGERRDRCDPCGEWGYMNPLLLDVKLCNAWGEPARPFWWPSKPPV